MDASEELRTIIRSANTLYENLAVAIENETGLSVGSRENIEETIAQIEGRISQTQDAINLLDEELHLIPITALKNLNENYHIPALNNAHNRLRQATDY